MSGYRSKKLSSNYDNENCISIDGLTIEQFELLSQMWGFHTEEDLHEWQDTLTLNQSKTVDSLVILILLEHFDRILNMENVFPEASEVISKFTLH